MLRAGGRVFEGFAIDNSQSFWTASDQWWTQGGEQGARLQGRAAKLQIGDLLGRKDFAKMPDSAQWYYQDPVNQKGLIRMGAGLSKTLFDLVQTLDANLSKGYDEHMGELALSAFDRWPVQSGLSKAMLELSYTSAGGKFIGTINSRAPYTRYIKKRPVKLYQDEGYQTTVKIANDTLNSIGGGRGGNRG
jgi:hypothetical protein